MIVPRKIIPLGIFFLVTLIFTFWIGRHIPPVQSPDENVHLLRADMIAHGQWLLQSKYLDNDREGGMADANFSSFVRSMLNIAGVEGDKSLTPDLLDKAENMRWSNEDSFQITAGTGYYLPIIYTPHAIGLFISRHLNLSMLVSYELTRALAAATALGIFTLAFSIRTPNALTLVLLLTPMSLFQLASPTIDGISSALTMLLISLWFSLSLSENEKNGRSRRQQEFWLYVCIFVLCTARTNMLPTLLIPLVILKQQYSRRRACSIALLYVITLGWIAFATLTTYDARVVRSMSSLQIMVNYITNPQEFFTLLQSTLQDTEIRKFYRNSYIGILGWLDTPIPKKSVRVLSAAIILILIFTALTTRWREALSTRITAFAVGGISIFLIFFALAVTWNLYPAAKIGGIQGRYFIIPTLFLAAAFGHIKPQAVKYKPLEIIAVAAFGIYSMHALLTTLSAQYKM
ncbi:MAG: DUF2142 domain-containing protein [Proteobacteria bacterium]|nr:DUF2142 domain-containing protein [Pseudomonadota bacterium]